MFRVPAVRLYLASAALAAVGQNLLVTVLFKQVFDITGNALDIGFIGLAQFLPALLLVLVSGWVADRFDRRRVTTLFMSGAWTRRSGTHRAFSTSGSTRVVWLFAIATFLGTADAMVAPARRSIMPFLADKSMFPQVVVVWTGTFVAASILGPIAGGFLYSVGASWAYGVAAVCQFAAAVPVLFIRYAP